MYNTDSSYSFATMASVYAPSTKRWVPIKLYETLAAKHKYGLSRHARLLGYNMSISAPAIWPLGARVST